MTELYKMVQESVARVRATLLDEQNWMKESALNAFFNDSLIGMLVVKKVASENMVSASQVDSYLVGYDLVLLIRAALLIAYEIDKGI